MFKLLIALSLFLAIQGGPIGGFIDRPELIESAATQEMLQLAVAELAKTENLDITPVHVFSVSSQLVNGVNFRIFFLARQSESMDELICSTKIYQTTTGARSVSSVKCV
jgi:hypothetical protein